MQDPGIRLFVGVDWATEAHQVCLLDPGGKTVEERSVVHSGTGLGELVECLLFWAGGGPNSVAVAIEVPHGAVVDTLLEHGFQVYSLNPKQLDRFRDRFTVAGAKDDRRDAFVLADSLRTDMRCFRRLIISAPEIIELREWSRMAEELQQEHVRLTNRVREQLRRYFPQALELTQDAGSPWFLALWAEVPTPAAALEVKPAHVARILKEHRIRKVTAEGALEVLRQKPVTVAPGTVEAATAHIRLVADRLRVVNKQLKECYQRLDKLTELIAGKTGSAEPGQDGEQSDAAILRSLPGVGRIVLATLLSEAAQPIAERDYQTLRALSGVAPVTKQSGKRRSVIMRTGCHLRLRGAMYHWSRVAVQTDPFCRASYSRLRKTGKTHGRALRGVADQLLRVVIAMLRDRSLYDAGRRQPKPPTEPRAAAG